jgi:Tfp pilus assembly protein PilF
MPWWIAPAAIVLAAVLGALWWAGRTPPQPDSAATAGLTSAGLPAARYVGSQACVSCHRAESAAWQGSQHAKAMQHATEQTVLGRFDGGRFTHKGVTSTFFRRDGRFLVNTDGPDGELHDYEIKYTFGVEPLQQYLVEFPGGRMQALSIAWDSRPREAGGQRWFHLYPDQRITHRDPLHWTRLDQNWNYMCAECHSTNLRRNYDLAQDRYATTWSELNVACEACHGPASGHLAWAGKASGWEAMADKGLAVALDERKGVIWRIDPATGNASRSRPAGSRREVETCAGCHARRVPFADGLGHGARLLDTHDPALLTRGLYFPDGQQRDEVYTYGSFLQSRMYAHGVSCSDCHEPHSARPRAPGNAVCAQCHLPAKYDAPAHTLHGADSKGGQCTACHMPTRSYMVVDPRHDHSMRIPRPDLSARLGTPNACNGCHRDRHPGWAAAAIERAFGPQRKGYQTYAEALYAGRADAPGATAGLVALAQAAAAPAIARATALAELGQHPGPGMAGAIEAGLRDADPLLRSAALDVLLAAPPQERARLAEPLLDDPVVVVRIKAARALAASPLDGLGAARRARRERAFAEYVASQVASGDRPEAHLNLALFHLERGEATRAEAEYRAALKLEPDFAPAWLNLADLYRALGRDEAGETVLGEGLQRLPGDGDLLHALGLLRVRQGRPAEALALLRQAAAARQDNPRYAYVYAVALNDAGRPGESLSVLRAALERFPNDRELLFAAAGYARAAGDKAAAARYARRLAAIAPGDPQTAAMLRETEGR